MKTLFNVNLCVMTLALMGALAPISSRATIHNISIMDSVFTPLNTVVTQGDTVKWTCMGSSGIYHTITSDPSSPVQWNSATMTPGGFSTFQIIITYTDPPGDYPYHCNFHVLLGKVDTLRVVAAAPDIDGDGILNQFDNCPLTSNPIQENSDTDARGDSCDNCPFASNPSQVDTDMDSTADACDNCPSVANPGQEDTDLDNIGDACETCCNKDGDVNHSGTINVADITYFVKFLFAGGPPPPCIHEANVNDAGGPSGSDVTYLIRYLFSGGPHPPGPDPTWCP
jgi:plastocyanin